MQSIVSHGLWKVIAKLAKKATQRQVAVAYVTEDLIGFKDGDELIVDASPCAIACGETSAKLLKRLNSRGVEVYSHQNLHAKVMLLDATAVIGSANMSNSSANTLVEAAIISDASYAVSGVASFIHQLTKKSKRLNEPEIQKLCAIKVIRRGGRPFSKRKPKAKIAPLGNRTWLVGLRELTQDPNSAEQQAIKDAAKALKVTDEDELEWIRWTGDGKFVRECRSGDSIIQIWRSATATRPSCVYAAAPVLLKQKKENWTRFYLGTPKVRNAKITWKAFQRLMQKLGYTRRLGPTIEQLLDPEVEIGIQQQWKHF